MLYVHPSVITPEHVQMMLDVNMKASNFERPDVRLMAQAIITGNAILFEVPFGQVVVEILESNGERRLNMLSFYCSKFGAYGRSITQDLQRLARDWNCATIQTVIWDKRLARQLQKLGCETEYTSLVLDSGLKAAQEKEDEHQEDVEANVQSDANSGTSLVDATGADRPVKPRHERRKPAADGVLPGWFHCPAGSRGHCKCLWCI